MAVFFPNLSFSRLVVTIQAISGRVSKASAIETREGHYKPFVIYRMFVFEKIAENDIT